MKITLFNGVKDTRPQPYTATFPELCDLLEGWQKVKCKRSDKLWYDAMIPGECGTRGNANVRSLSLPSADFDIGPDDPRYLSFQAFCDKLDREGLAYFAYTTTKNSGSHNRFRVLLPYAEAVPLECCRAAWHACNARFEGAIDASTKDPARLSFLPATWTENPFYEPKSKDADAKGMVTLIDPFNAFRVKASGKPILSVEEIAALDPIFSGAMNFAPEPVGTAKMPSSPKVKARGYGRAFTPVLSDADRVTLSHGKGSDNPCWTIIADLSRSPLVKRWMLEKLPSEQGSRDYRFLLAAARYALGQNIPVRVATLTTLAEQFSRQYLRRAAPSDIARQAENALAWAFNNPTDPRQPEAGSNP